VAKELNPEALRRPQAKNKLCSDKEFVERVIGDKAMSFTNIIKEAENALEMSRRTAMRYLERLTSVGIITQGGGLYWAKKQGESA
jgi:hypothetical protein